MNSSPEQRDSPAPTPRLHRWRWVSCAPWMLPPMVEPGHPAGMRLFCPPGLTPGAEVPRRAVITWRPRPSSPTRAGGHPIDRRRDDEALEASQRSWRTGEAGIPVRGLGRLSAGWALMSTRRPMIECNPPTHPLRKAHLCPHLLITATTSSAVPVVCAPTRRCVN